MYFFYEDSEGDLNVVSEDEDLADAKLYANQKQKTLHCSLVAKDLYETIRKEQEQSILNQSQTWFKNDAYRSEKAKVKLPKDQKKMLKMQVKHAVAQMNQMEQLGQSLDFSQVSEIPHQQSEVDLKEIMSSAVQIPMGESVVLEKFKNKMGTIISNSTLQFQAAAGSLVPIQLTVRNKALQPWPRSPFLCVEKSDQYMMIEETLGPNESTQVTFDFYVPEDAQRICVC